MPNKSEWHFERCSNSTADLQILRVGSQHRYSKDVEGKNNNGAEVADLLYRLAWILKTSNEDEQKHTKLFLREWIVTSGCSYDGYRWDKELPYFWYATKWTIPWIPVLRISISKLDAMFRTQIVPSSKASVHGHHHVPMVALWKNLHKAVYEEEKANLLVEGGSCDDIQVGTMIEILGNACRPIPKEEISCSIQQTTWSNTQWQQTVWASFIPLPTI